MGVVDDQVGLAVGQRGDFADREGGEAVADDAEVAVGAEADRFAVDERDDRVVAGLGVLEGVERVVVEDRAVLVDLHERGTAVLGGGP